MPPTAQPTVLVSRPLHPPSRGQSQPSLQPPPAISVPVAIPPTALLPSPDTSASAWPPQTSLPSPSPSPSQPPSPVLPTAGLSSTAEPLLIPSMVLAVETPSQVAVRMTQSALPRPSRLTSTRMPEGCSSALAPTSELPPSPPRTPSPTPVEDQLREEVTVDCSVCDETLAAPMVYLGCCPHRLHLPCYAALRVRAEASLRCPASRATATINEADRMAIHQHSNEVMVEALTTAQQDLPANGGAKAPTGTTRGQRRRRVICSICHGLVEATVCVQVSYSCEVHRRCALGFCEDAIPRARISGGVH